MPTIVMRHARTALSSRYVVNGDPAAEVPLDDAGIASCAEARSLIPTGTATWLTSSFLRTRQTARLLGGDNHTVLPELDELDYGEFEGEPFIEYAMWLDKNGPHAVVPGGRESQRAGIKRMLTGVQRSLAVANPRVVVCHGLLLSVLRWQMHRKQDVPMPLFFPETAPAQPWSVDDVVLRGVVRALAEGLDERAVFEPGPHPASWARTTT